MFQNFKHPVLPIVNAMPLRVKSMENIDSRGSALCTVNNSTFPTHLNALNTLLPNDTRSHCFSVICVRPPSLNSIVWVSKSFISWDGVRVKRNGGDATRYTHRASRRRVGRMTSIERRVRAPKGAGEGSFSYTLPHVRPVSSPTTAILSRRVFSRVLPLECVFVVLRRFCAWKVVNFRVLVIKVQVRSFGTVWSPLSSTYPTFSWRI